MSKYYKLLKVFTFLIFALFIMLSSPKPTIAAPLSDIFSSPDSLIVKIQERIEYFFAFKIEQKIIILEKQAERRLTRAESLAKTKDVDQVPSLIKRYKTLKEKQGELIREAPPTDLVGTKERTIEQQARIENMKDDVSSDEKEIIEESQRTVIKTMMDTIDASGTTEDENEATEFAEEVKNVLDPGSNIFAPGTNEVAPGILDVAPGTLEVSP